MYSKVDRASPGSLEMDTAQGLNIQHLEYSFGQYYDTSSPYMPQSEVSSRAMQQFDQADSSSRTCRSESGSVYDSPMSVSPMLNGLHPSFQSPSSTGSFPSPNHHQLSPSSAVTALYYSSPNLDIDRDTPSPRPSPEDRGSKPSCVILLVLNSSPEC